jgi:catechol 2,3-dioxygenase-like lactoylglutathione lyase family enzyme
MDNSTTLVPSTIKGMHHVGIAVSDVERSVEFYQSVTALKRIDHDNIAGYLPEPCEKSAVLKGPNGYLQLMQFAGPTDLSEVPVPALHIFVCNHLPKMRYSTSLLTTVQNR